MNRKIGVVLSYIAMVFEVLSTLLLTPFIIRTLGDAEYGVYRLSATVISYLLLLDLGVGNAVIRYISKYRANNDKEACENFLGVSTIYYLIIALIALVIGFVLVLSFSNLFATGLTETELQLGKTLLFFTMINAVITLGTSGYSNVIIAFEKFAFSKGSSILSIILKIVFSFLALHFGLGSLGIVLVHLGLTTLFRSINVLYVLFVLKLKPKLKKGQTGYIKEVILYSTWILFQTIASQINSSVDSVLLGTLIKESAILIAIYSIGTQVVQYFKTIASSFTGVLMPGIVKLVEDGANSDKLCDEMIRIGRIIFMMLSLIFICFVFYGNQFVYLWSGDGHEESFIVATILMFAYMFVWTISIGTQILWAKNKHKEQAIMKLTVVLINIILTVFLIKWKPILGATIGTFISLMVGDVIVGSIIFRKKIGISLKKYYFGLFKGILPCLLITGGLGYLFSLLKLTGWIGFIINVAFMVAIYALLMFLFGLNKYEKNLICNIFGKLFKKRKNNDEKSIV